MNCSKCGLPITFAEADKQTTSLQHTTCPTMPTPLTPTQRVATTLLVYVTQYGNVVALPEAFAWELATELESANETSRSMVKLYEESEKELEALQKQNQSLRELVELIAHMADGLIPEGATPTNYATVGARLIQCGNYAKQALSRVEELKKKGVL